MSTATNVNVSRDEKSWEMILTAEITPEALESSRTKALADLQKTAAMDGFRPGKVPLDKVLESYGESAVMRRAAEIAIHETLPELIAKEEIVVIEAPKVTTDTPERGKPLKITARAAMAPKIEIADYAAIAEKLRAAKEETSVSDTEHEDAMTHLRRERARIDRIESGTEPSKAAEETKDLGDDSLPQLDDEFAQSIGYDNADAFKTALRENIKHEKELQAQQKVRSTILDDIVKQSTIHFPAALTEYELDEMEGRMNEDLTRAGMALETYLASIKKTRDDVRAEWRPAAETRAKVRLILAEIARKESIEPSSELVGAEVSHALQHYPGANPESIRPSVVHALRNEMALRFLEGNTEPLAPSGHDHQH